MKFLGIALLYIFLIPCYLIISLIIGKNISIIFIVALILLSWVVIRILMEIRAERTHRLRKSLFLIVNMILIGIVLLWNCIINKLEMATVCSVGDLGQFIGYNYWEYVELKDYNKNFNEQDYNGVKILYEDSAQAALPLMEMYIDHAISECEKIFGKIKSEFTIKLDYDEAVFLSRNIDGFDNLSGYYIPNTKTIHLYVEDAYDILRNINDFRETLVHEISHYYLLEFTQENDILYSSIPSWIDEGLAEYISEGTSSVYFESIKYFPFEQLYIREDWNNIKSGEHYKQAKYAIAKIININVNDEKTITNLLLELKKKDFVIAFQYVFGQEFSEFANLIKDDTENNECEYIEIPQSFNIDDYNEVRIQGYEDYILEYPNNISAYQILANYYKNEGEVEKAINVIKLGMENNPDSELLPITLEHILM